MWNWFFTFWAKVEVLANWAFIAYSYNRTNSTTITYETFMNNLIFVKTNVFIFHWWKWFGWYIFISQDLSNVNSNLRKSFLNSFVEFLVEFLIKPFSLSFPVTTFPVMFLLFLLFLLISFVKINFLFRFLNFRFVNFNCDIFNFNYGFYFDFLKEVFRNNYSVKLRFMFHFIKKILRNNYSWFKFFWNYNFR